MIKYIIYYLVHACTEKHKTIINFFKSKTIIILTIMFYL